MLRHLLTTLLVLMIAGGVSAQDRAVITAENAGQLRAPLYTGLGNANALALSPDGTLLIVGTGTGAYVHKTDDLGTQQPFAYVGTGIGVYDVAFNEEGSQVALALSDGSVELFDPVTGVSNRSWRCFEEAATALAFSPDGTSLAVGSASGQVITYTVKDGSQTAEFEGLTARVLWLAYDPKEPHLIGSAQAGITPFVAWDLTNGTVLYTLTSGPLGAFSPDGTQIAIPLGSVNVELVDASTGREMTSYSVSGRGTTNIGFMPDGRVISAGGDFLIRLDDINLNDDADTSIHLQGHHTYIDDIAVSPDGATLYSVADDGLLIAWNVADGTIIEQHQAYTGYQHVLAAMNDNHHVAIGGDDGLLTIWDVDTDTSVQMSGALNPDMVQGAIYGLDFTPDESIIVVGNNQGFVQGLRYPAFESLWLFATQWAPVHLEVSPDGKTVAAGGSAGILLLYPTDGSQKKATEQDAEDGEISAVHWTPNGVTVATGSTSPTIHLYTTDKTTPYFTVNVPYTVYDFAYSPIVPNGDLIAISAGSYSQPYAGLYNFATKTETILEGATAIVKSLTFSPDGALVAAGDTNGYVRLYDATTGVLVAQLPRVNSGPIADLEFSPDGTRLFSTSYDGTTNLWQIPETHSITAAQDLTV